MTKAALLRIVRQARKTAMFRWSNGIGWETLPLPRNEQLLVEEDDLGIDYRGREDDDDYEWFNIMTVPSSAHKLTGDEVLRIQCWQRDTLRDVWHLDLRTGEKVEVAPGYRPRTNVENPTTTGVLPERNTQD